MTRRRWMVAPGGRVAHLFEPAGDEGGIYYVNPHSRWPKGKQPHWETEAVEADDDTPRCKRCAARGRGR